VGEAERDDTEFDGREAAQNRRLGLETKTAKPTEIIETSENGASESERGEKIGTQKLRLDPTRATISKRYNQR
jgi:hypothetical protein